MLSVVNQIEACRDWRKRTRDFDAIDLVVFHRISLAKDGPEEYPDVAPLSDEETDAAAIAARFRDTRRYRPGAYTGGEMPYQVIIGTDGAVFQAAELSDNAPHARIYNERSIGVGVVGDFRRYMPTDRQVASCVLVGAAMVAAGLDLNGHDELPGAARPGKECPGRWFDMVQLRSVARALAAMLRKDNELSMLQEAGFVI